MARALEMHSRAGIAAPGANTTFRSCSICKPSYDLPYLVPAFVTRWISPKANFMPTSLEPIERAAQLGPLLCASAGRIDSERQLPEDVLTAMHSAALFRLSLPRFVAGEELNLPSLAQVTQMVARFDASAAWCLGQASGCAMSAAFLEPSQAREVFGPQNAVLAWGAGVQGEARMCDGGFRVTGTWRFASGGHHATWLGAHCRVLNEDGSPRLGASGKGQVRTMLVPRERAEILDDWHVLGLRGTRSEGYTLTDEFVASERSLDRENPEECRVATPLYVIPTTNVYASVFSGVALGIARASLDDLTTLARTKRARGASTALRDSAVFQTDLAELTARWRAAHAYQSDAIARVWDAVESTMAIPLEERVQLRLATTFAIRQSNDIVAQVYRMAGSDAIFEGQPFERRFRDMHAVSQQVQGRATNFETVGRHLLGHEVTTTFL
jgi:indole-3-acetate monooxygenase